MPKSVHRRRAARRLRNQRGFTLIDMLFVVGLIGLLSSLALPTLTRARGAAHASSALATLRVINSSQLSFAITCGRGFYAPDLPALGNPPPLSTEPFLSNDLTGAALVIKSGYTFGVSAIPLPEAPESCNGLLGGSTATGYVATADPLDPNVLARYFGTNTDGGLFEHTSSYAGVMPEAGSPAQGRPAR